MSIVLDGTTGITTPGLTNTGTETIVNLTTTGNTILGDASTDTLNVGNGGLVKDASGNVGIGTSSPRTVSNYTTVGVNGTTGGIVDLFSSGTRTATFSADSGAANITSVTAIPLVFNTSNTERARIDSSGNVGIGISSPATKLDVTGPSGTTSFTGANALGVTVRGATSSNDYSGIDFRSSGANGGATVMARIAAVATGAGSNLSFGTCNSYGSGITNTAMTIDPSGNLLVGATSSPSTYSIATFRGTNKGIAIQDSSTGNYRAIYGQSGSLYFYNGSNEGYLSSAGAWVNASDAKLKNSIVDIKYGLTAVMNTQPRSYKMNDLDGDYVGFVAQELQEVIPEVVSGDPEKQLGVDYGSLVAVAFKAIQEQQALITQLQADVAALKGTA